MSYCYVNSITTTFPLLLGPTALLYLYMRACKCQLFTDKGSRRLPKRLNYCFSVLASATNRSITAIMIALVNCTKENVCGGILQLVIYGVCESCVHILSTILSGTLVCA